jgi:hypothetical protein
MTRSPVCLLALLVACSTSPEAPPSQEGIPPTALRLHGRLLSGQHSVGFIKELVPAAPDGPTSPLDLYLWYPAISETGDSWRFADYYVVQEKDPPSREQLRQWLLEDMTSPPGLVPEDMDQLLDAPVWARRDARPAPGRYPLVLWSYRDSIPTMQGILAEYLASHGFAVAFVWPQENAPPLPWQAELDTAGKLASVRDQLSILQAGLAWLTEDSRVDGSRRVVLSWSYGGESANLLQLEGNSNLRLSLGIDSTLISGWILQPPEALEELDPAAMTTPTVLLKHGRPRIGGDESPEPPALKLVGAGAAYVRFPNLHHGNFNVPGGLFPGLLGLSDVSGWAVGGEPAQRGYEEVCRLVLGFVSAALNAEAEDATLLPANLEEPEDGFFELRLYPSN